MSWGPGFVITIVAIALFAGIVKEYLRGKREEAPQRDEEWAQTLARIEELEERIRVLERIVTDPKDTLKREINSL